jgi:hypothetical protein
LEHNIGLFARFWTSTAFRAGSLVGALMMGGVTISCLRLAQPAPSQPVRRSGLRVDRDVLDCVDEEKRPGRVCPDQRGIRSHTSPTLPRWCTPGDTQGTLGGSRTLDLRRRARRTPQGIEPLTRVFRERRRRDLNPRTPYGISTLAGWCTRPNYATSPVTSAIIAAPATLFDSSTPCIGEPLHLVRPMGDS